MTRKYKLSSLQNNCGCNYPKPRPYDNTEINLDVNELSPNGYTEAGTTNINKNECGCVIYQQGGVCPCSGSSGSDDRKVLSLINYLFIN